jgi:hypothetical protein
LHHVQTADYDICLISETWLRKNDPLDDAVVAQLKTSGYDFLHSPRLNTNRGGGLAIFFKSSWSVTVIKQRTYSTFELGIWNVKSQGLTLTMVCIYRPPYSHKHPRTVKAFIKEFSEIWSSILASYDTTRLLLTGDFNIHWDNQQNPDTQAFTEMLESFGCTQHVGVNTHELGHIIDMCITPSDTQLYLTTPSADYFISDHAFISFHINIPRPPVEKALISTRRIADINTDTFRQDLQAVCDDIINYSNKELADEYDYQLTGLLDRHAPVITKSVRVRKKVAWFDKRARDMKKQLRQQEKKWKRSGTQYDRDTFKSMKNTYRKHLRQNRVSHFKEAVHQARGNSKQLYSVTLGLMGKKQPNPLPEAQSNKDLADEFATFFLHKIERIRDDLKDIPKFVPSYHDTGSMSSFHPLTCEEVLKLVRTSKPTTTTTDPLPSALVKEHIDILCPLLTKLVNESLVNANFFDQWKMAVVVPLLKKIGSELTLPSYRPVSNLCFASKITEKGSISQLRDHIKKCKLEVDHQSAYKENFSCETAVVFLMNSLLWKMENNCVSFMTGLDLSSAFDTPTTLNPV